MKRLISLLMAAILLCGAFPALAEDASSHVLVVYFSRPGENYNVGVVEEGNTAKLAKIIAAQMNADVFEIVPEVPYPSDYDSTLAIATQEKNEDARPAYLGDAESWEQYDAVFIGYPIWWYTTPKIMETFFETYDLGGITIIPFNTHAGSRDGGTYSLIKDREPEATLLDGLAVRGEDIGKDNARNSVEEWLDGLNLE